MTHYKRWRRHGDPLGGNTSRGEPERFFREIVLRYDGDECLIWPYARSTKGYGQLYIDGRSQIVSRLVCEEENGPPPTSLHEAAHRCGRGCDGCVTRKHLRWATHAENVAETVMQGSNARGEGHGNAQFTESEILEIRALRGKLLQREIAQLFGTNQQTISDIHCRRSWAWLE